MDEEIRELWEAACNYICEAEPPAPLEAIAVLDLIARDATRLVDEQIVSLLGDGVATPTAIGQTLGMSRQSVMKRAHTWISHNPQLRSDTVLAVWPGSPVPKPTSFKEARGDDRPGYRRKLQPRWGKAPDDPLS